MLLFPFVTANLESSTAGKVRFVSHTWPWVSNATVMVFPTPISHTSRCFEKTSVARTAARSCNALFLSSIYSVRLDTCAACEVKRRQLTPQSLQHASALRPPQRRAASFFSGAKARTWPHVVVSQFSARKSHAARWLFPRTSPEQF